MEKRVDDVVRNSWIFEGGEGEGVALLIWLANELIQITSANLPSRTKFVSRLLDFAHVYSLVDN